MPTKQFAPAVPSPKTLPVAMPAPVPWHRQMTNRTLDSLEKMNARATTITLVLAQILDPRAVPPRSISE